MNNRTILIADDDINLVHLLRSTLEPLAGHIYETYNATSALAMIQCSPPSLVIFDITMPGGNGLSACEMLKTDKTTSGIPVIILSGSSDDITRGRCMQMGAHFVCKGPEALSDVKRLVEILLAVSHLVGSA